jgi:hypothetical protein
MNINDIIFKKTFPRFVERFENKFIPEPMSGCWLWLEGLNGGGYGWCTVYDAPQLAHRISYAIYKGFIGKDDNGDPLCVLHRCDMPSCVNPDHLFLGSYQDNADDRGRKGRTRAGRGVRHWRAKLTEEQVRAIFIDQRSCNQLALIFGVSKSTVLLIKQGRSWRHITGAKAPA